MSTQSQQSRVSRRTAVTGLSIAGLGLAAARPALGSAQDAAADMANHPMVGTFLAGRRPDDLVVSHFSPDGNMLNNGPISEMAQDGTHTFADTPMGSWVPVSERGIHFIFTRRNYDANGVFVGYSAVEGYPVANEDGMTFWDDGTKVTITIMDTTGAVVQVIGPGIPDSGIGGVRIIPGVSGYAEMLAMIAANQPDSATPQS